MKKKSLLLLLGLLGILLLLGACQSSDSKDSGDSGNEEEITLTLWGGVAEEFGAKQMIEEWESENPNIKIKYETYKNDEDGNLRLNTALQTNQDIDLFTSYGTLYIEQRAESGFALNLDEFDDLDIEAEYGEGVQGYQYEGSNYSIPVTTTPHFLHINEDALKEAGLEVPEKWTWKEVREYAKILSEQDFEYGLLFESWVIDEINKTALTYPGPMNENGESNFDHPNILEAYESIHAMMYEDESVPKYGEIITNTMPDIQRFLNGDVPMILSGAWVLRDSHDIEEYPRDFTTAFAPFPTFEGEDYSAPILGDAVSINSNTKYPDEAWEFLKWYGEQGILHWTYGGRIPAMDKIDAEEIMSNMFDGVEDYYNLDTAKKAMIYDKNLKQIPVYSNKLNDKLKEEYEKYFLDEQSLEDTVEKMKAYHEELSE